MRQIAFEDRGTVRSIEELLESVARAQASHEGDREGGRWYFRGDDAETEIDGPKPHIGREREFAGIRRVPTFVDEQLFFDRFCRFEFAHLKDPTSPWESLFVAQHYGLPTRLLDWTSNVLVAAYFACSFKKPSDADCGIVWGIQKYRSRKYNLRMLKHGPGGMTISNPLRKRLRPMIKLVYPFYNSERIRAQHGYFSWHSQPAIGLRAQCDRRFLDSSLDILRLARWRIVRDGGRWRHAAVLERLGITAASLFPDLQGIADGIWQTTYIREPTRHARRR